MPYVYMASKCFIGFLFILLMVSFAMQKILVQCSKQQLELDMEQQTGSKWEKEYVKAVYCHPAYLTSMQSTS